MDEETGHRFDLEDDRHAHVVERLEALEKWKESQDEKKERVHSIKLEWIVIILIAIELGVLIAEHH